MFGGAEAEEAEADKGMLSAIPSVTAIAIGISLVDAQALLTTGMP
jgi:hypothetical protein